MGVIVHLDSEVFTVYFHACAELAIRIRGIKRLYLQNACLGQTNNKHSHRPTAIMKYR